jgi:hypothetical protein
MKPFAFNFGPGGFLRRRIPLISSMLMLVGFVPASYAQTATPVANASPKTPRVSVVDIIPESLSGETDDDWEANIAVDPVHPEKIAASAFTREPLRANKAPIFVSLDGGQHWSCHSIVPSPQITCDITLRFGSSSGVLYVSALRNELQGYKRHELIICESKEYATTRLMAEVFSQRDDIDQPYITAATVASKDHVFVGDKDYNYKCTRIDNGLSAIDRSLDSPRGSFTPFSIESRDLYGDGCEVRPAMSGDGKVVYVAFNHLTKEPKDGDIERSAAVVVVRDDQGGASTPPFSSLKDPGDKKHGVLVVKKRTYAWDRCLGGDRLGGDLALAAHPGNADKVYLVWSDLVNNRVTLHLAYSNNGGNSWSRSVRDVPDAKNPGLAVNAQGTVGFLYQQVVNMPEGNIWMTQFEQTTDDFKSAPSPLTLAKFPTDALLYSTGACDDTILGDYLQLLSVGNDFYGIFCSNNIPDLSRFRYGVTFLRKTDSNSKKLFDLQNIEVNPSIDPFFFKVTE